MKILFLILFFTASLFAQDVRDRDIVLELEAGYHTLMLNSASRDTAIVLWPQPWPIRGLPRVAIYDLLSEIPDAITTPGRYAFTGDALINLSIWQDGDAALQQDSLFAYIKPLIYDQTIGWTVPRNDSIFLVFDTAGTYVDTAADYLDWTYEHLYISHLSGRLWVCPGIMIIFQNLDYHGVDVDALLDVELGVWVRR